MNELYFLGMDIATETKKLMNITTIAFTDGMTESELRAYKLGVENTISALKAVMEEDEVVVVNINGMDIPTELTVEELENIYNEEEF